MRDQDFGQQFKRYSRVVLSAVAIGAAACGGGSKDKPTPTLEPYASITATPILTSTEVPPPTVVPTQARELTPTERFGKNSTEFKLLAAQLPLNNELVLAIQKNPSYANIDQTPPIPFPDYKGMEPEKVKATFKEYILANWNRGVERINDPKVDFADGITYFLYSVEGLAVWLQSPYLSSEAKLQWQKAYVAGKSAVYDVLDEILLRERVSEVAKSNTTKFLADFFARDEFKFTESGQVNPNAPLIPGIASVSK